MKKAEEAIVAYRKLPDERLRANWDRIWIADELRKRLLGQALLSVTMRPKLSAVGATLHGLIVLQGPPGTGKSTIARGLANKVAELVLEQADHTIFLEVDPHVLPSELLGKSQQAVTNLLVNTIGPLAASGKPVIVLVDEVEAFAVRRTTASMSTNPVDVHRATDAVLAGLDRLAGEYPRLLFLATTNFTTGVDEAFLSRADAVFTFELPDQTTAQRILLDTLEEYARQFPELAGLANESTAAEVASHARGLDGRQLRKLIALALSMDPEIVLDPSKLGVADLIAAARHARVRHDIVAALDE